MRSISIIDSIDDYALLAALDALLQERHVTRAAARLGITQSSMSHHLARLRGRFGDPLLVRSGRAMLLTPRAEAMAGPLREALDALRRAVRAAEVFDPRESERAFTLSAPDLLAPMLPALLAALAGEAPKVALRLVAPPAEVAAALSSGSPELLVGSALAAAPGVMQRRLGAISWCVLARRGHPALRGRFTIAKWSAHPHVLVRSGSATPNRVAKAMLDAGVTRRVGVEVQGFLAAPWVVAHTDMLFTAPKELVTELAAALDLVSLPPPIALPSLGVAVMWHERYDADPAHRWLRGVVSATLTERLSARRGAIVRGRTTSR